MWKSLGAERKNRNKISSALDKLRRTTEWQKTTLLDKTRMNQLEICRVSALPGEAPPLSANVSMVRLFTRVSSRRNVDVREYRKLSPQSGS